jgi:hypothetical protein
MRDGAAAASVWEEGEHGTQAIASAPLPREVDSLRRLDGKEVATCRFASATAAPAGSSSQS